MPQKLLADWQVYIPSLILALLTYLLLARLVLEHYRVIDDLRTAIPRPLSFQLPPD